MSSTEKLKALGAALLIGAAAMAAPGIAQAAIVVAASGPSAKDFPVGKKLDDTKTIALRTGDSVTVLDQRGTRILRGNGQVAVGRRNVPARNATFAILTRQGGAQRVRTGAVRNDGGSGKVMSPNLWYVDISRPGTKCLVDPASVQLWRADSGKSARYTIAAAGSPSGEAAFASGAMLAPWDMAKAPIADGKSYTLNGGGQPAQLTFAVLPSQPANPEALAEALIAKGCMAQFELLAASLKPGRG